MPSDFMGIDFYTSDDTGHFRDTSVVLASGCYGFGMAHTFGDFDENSRLNVLMISMNAYMAD
ncbi:MAG: hypothetical protein M2R45_01309 [Verrucomicrobia subdivision 3 bacterium]|nr:hypothetical protein [Limisphaerales bacterium]MCS1415175.1 hypothetical protein [Limisphaerales bacterium]